MALVPHGNGGITHLVGERIAEEEYLNRRQAEQDQQCAHIAKNVFEFLGYNYPEFLHSLLWLLAGQFQKDLIHIFTV